MEKEYSTAKILDYLKNKEYASNIKIPKMAFYTFMGTVIIIVGSAWIDLRVRFAHMEKETEILKVRLTKEEVLIQKTNERYEDIQRQLYDIKSAIEMKQDKRFVE